MKGDEKVIEFLNQVLSKELAARDQFFIHSKMYDDWGYQKLKERIAHEMEDEQDHASQLVERILFLGGLPGMANVAPLTIGKTVPEMLQNDLDLEYNVAGLLRTAIEYCESVRDFTSSQILIGLLKDTEEDHTLWLEQQLGHIERVGLENYLMTCL